MKKLTKKAILSLIADKQWRRFLHSELEDTIDGIPYALGHKWLALKSTVDYRMDGLLLVPRKKLKKIFSSTSYEHSNSIFRGEGVADQPAPDIAFNLDSTLKLLTSLKDAHEPVTFELADPEEGDYILIGHIIAIEDKCVSMATVDMDGVWTDEHVPFREIAAIRLRSGYMDAALKYAVPLVTDCVESEHESHSD